MSSTFSSTRAEYDSANSNNDRPQSRPVTVSERSTSASRHSRTSKPSSKDSSGISSAPASNPSDGSFSKPNFRTPSIHSTESSHKNEPNTTLAEVSIDDQVNADSQQTTLPMIERYLACPIRSSLHNVSTTTTMIKAEHEVRMQSLLDDLVPQFGVSGVYTNTSDTPVDMYDTELDLEESDSEEQSSKNL